MSKTKLALLSIGLLVIGYSIGSQSDERLIKEATSTGKSFISQQKYIEAKAMLEFVRKQDPKSVNAMLGQLDTLILANEYYENKEYQSAMVQLKILKESKDIESGLLKGVYELEKKIEQITGKNLEDDTNNSSGTIVSELITWDNIAASSYLSGQSRDYSPKQAIDRDATTAWVENGTGENANGVNEYIELSSQKLVTIEEIHMINGLANGVDTYNKNNRIKDIKIEFYNSQNPNEVEVITHTLEDKNSEYQIIKVGGKSADSIRIYIEDIYSDGSKYNDTCISEILTYGQAKD